MNNLNTLLKSLLAIWILVATFQAPLDLDLGWHLRYGEYFFQTGHVLKDNILSIVWPDYKWVQASWGYDLLVYQIFTRLSFFGLSLTASVISLLIFWILTRPWAKLSLPNLLFLSLVFLTQTPPLYASGLRSQTPSALLFALVLTLPSTLYPLLFLLWANLHGGFALGLILVTILLLPKLRQPKILLTLLLSWLTPIINPWGLRIYQETFRHSTNINLAVISEWMPLSFPSVVSVVFLLVLTTILLIAAFRRQRADLPLLATILITAYLGFTAQRFLINFGILSTFYLAHRLPKLPPFTMIVTILLLIYFWPPNFPAINFSWANYCQPLQSTHLQAQDCSEEITQIMLSAPPAGAGFHPYNYGGYLSWRVPQVKTFIDGRMAAWQDNGRTPPVIAGDQVFLDKTPLTWRKFDSEYHFAWAIIPTQTPLVTYLNSLVTTGSWQRLYQDQFYSYYVKK